MKTIKVWLLSISITLVPLLLITVNSQIAYAETGSFTYNNMSNGISITGYNGNESDLTIPQEIDGQVVVGVSKDAFSSSTNLTSIVIPEGVINIGDNAFSNCTNLARVRFMGDAPTIGDQAFTNCSSGFIIDYEPSKNGFTNPWNSFTTEAYTSAPTIAPIPTITPIPIITTVPFKSSIQIISPDPTNVPNPTVFPDLTITPVPGFGSVTGINLDQTYVSLIAGQSLNLVATITPLEATNSNIIWTSSDTSVVTVNEDGIINAVSGGNAIITVTTEDGGFTATCSINVYNLLNRPSNELGVSLNYDTTKINWTAEPIATGYEIYRTDSTSGDYIKIATVSNTEYKDFGLRTGTLYYYKVRSYLTTNNSTIYSDFTPVILVKTLDKTIGSTLFLYMSDLNNRNSVVAKAVSLHYGDPSNTCALTSSEALRRLGISIPIATMRTNQVEDQLIARGWQREMNLNLLQPGDICFTTDKYGNLLGGHSTHVFIFMGWANKEKTLMNICDNQVSRYGSVLHPRTIFNTSLTDATAFFYHTNTPSVSMILTLPSPVNAVPITYNKVKLSWNTAAGAYGYKIYRSTSKYGTYVNISSTKGTSFTNTTVTPGKTYYYKVRAYSYIGPQILYGNYSSITAATPVLSTPAVNVTANSNNKVQLSWAGVSSASGYQIYRSTISNGSFSLLTSTSKSYYINYSLVSGKVYSFKIRAYRYVGIAKIYSNYYYINVKVA